MIQKESEAQDLVMHSIRITFMPGKVSVPNRNGKKHHMGGLSYVQHEYGLQYFNLCVPDLSFMTSLKKKTNYMHFISV